MERTVERHAERAAPHDLPVAALLADLAARDVRLTLDGDRLRLNAPAGALDEALKAALAARKAELVAALRAAGPAGAAVGTPVAAPVAAPVALRPVSRTGPLPVSYAQQRLWFMDRLQPGSAHYGVALALRLAGALDRGALAGALDAFTRRQESLRVRVRDEDGNPRLDIDPDATAALREVDLSGLAPEAREAEATRLTTAGAQEPFDLARGPVARYLLLRLSADDHRLLLCMHHIASDGWSLGVAAREIFALYDAHVAGRPSPLAPLAVQYVDFAAWQREQVASGSLDRQMDYWRRELEGAPAVLELPADRPRPPVQSFRGARWEQSMPDALVEEVKALGRAHDATLYMTLLAAWQVLLHRHSGQDDVVVGAPMANRDSPELEALVGCFVNNVVLRGRLGGNPTFRAYLAQVKGTVLRAFDHRELPFDRLVEGLRPERSTSHSPLFQVLFTLHSFPFQAVPPAGLAVRRVELPAEVARFDVTLEMSEHEGGLRLLYEYATDLFDAATIERLHAQYVTLLREVAADADRPVRDLPLLADDDARRLLDRVNDTARAYDRSTPVHALVRRAAERAPDAVAVEAADGALTYAALERRANQVAHLLRARGVGPGALVGVCLDRTSWLPAALLGVLRAGAAYLPADPAHPAERLAYTLSDAGVACVITDAAGRGAVAGAGVPLLCVDADAAALAAQPPYDPEVRVAPGDLAYVIYTSGSTGRPKGVEIEHRSLANFLHAMREAPGMGADDVLLAVTTPSFDIAGLELFLPLVSGARTVIAPREAVVDGERLMALAESSGATVLQATPATWRLLVDAGWAGGAGLTALCGGEALPRDLARALTGRVGALWNMYGPTETTVWSTVHRVTDCDRDIPIGRPIANTTVYVLDAANRPAPLGVPGELCIGGEGVARGYRDRAELTAEKFVTLALPGRPLERVYRTGDLVRLRGDLTLEFVGRRDNQVKVRGYRIELGEIESVLAEHPAVRRAVAAVREDAPGDRRIVGYVVPAGGDAPPAEALRALLRERLPEYMVPSAIVALAELPLTPNGKVDRKALPAPAAARPRAADPVMTDAQRRVAAVWCAVLRVDRVGLYENFFDLGGHSLLVVKVHAALRREFGGGVTVVDLFQRSTVAAQAELVTDGADRDAALRRAQARSARQAVA